MPCILAYNLSGEAVVELSIERLKMVLNNFISESYLSPKGIDNEDCYYNVTQHLDTIVYKITKKSNKVTVFNDIFYLRTFLYDDIKRCKEEVYKLITEVEEGGDRVQAFIESTEFFKPEE